MAKMLMIFNLRGTHYVLALFVSLLLGIMFFIAKDKKKILLGAIFVSLPFMTHNFIGTRFGGHQGGTSGLFFTFYDLPVLFLFVYVLANARDYINRGRLVSPYCVFLGVFFVIVLLSFLQAVQPIFSLFALVRLSVFVLMYLVVFFSIRQKADVNAILKVIFSVFLIELLIGVFQFFKGHLGLGLIGEGRLIMCNGFPRVCGTLGHSNLLSAYLVFVLAILYAFFLKKGGFKYLFLFAFGSGILVMTQSRGGWVSYVLAIIAVHFFSLFSKNKLSSSSIKYLFFFMVLAIVGFVLGKDLIWLRLFSDDSGAAVSRVGLAKVALSIIKAHPFGGIGLNNYSLVMHLYDKTLSGISYRLPYVVHNAFLLIAAEVGVFGCFVFSLFYVKLFSGGIAFIKKTVDVHFDALMTGLLAGFVGFFFKLMFENVDLSHHGFFMFFCFAGLVSALIYMRREGQIK